MNFPEWVSAMPVREVLDVVLSYLKVLFSWPGVVLIALILFRRKIAESIGRLKSVTPTKLSFHDLKETADNARLADEAATSKLEEASPSDSASGTRDTRSRPSTPEAGAEATGAGDMLSGSRDGDEPAERSALRRRILGYLADDDAAISRPSRAGKQSSRAPVDLVNEAWRRLEDACRGAARSLGLDALRSGSVLLRPSWGPVEVFDALYLEGRGSRQAVEAALQARRLRLDLNNGAAIDEDEAVALVDAIEDLRSTVRKLAAIKNGEKIVKAWLARNGHETLPKLDETK
jgi:hypothetical protein